MDDKQLRKAVIRLAYRRPSLRPEILSLLKQGGKDSLYGRIKGFMLEVAEELGRMFGSKVSGLLERRGGGLTGKPWVIGVAISEEAQKDRRYDLSVAVHLDREDPFFVLLDMAIPHKPKQLATGGFSNQMSSPKQAAQAIRGQCEMS